MKAVLVCDSEFGNTARIAQAIADGLGGRVAVRIATASEAMAELPLAADLLLVGGPTQRHGLSPALQAFLAALPKNGLRGVPAATFDTRYRMSALLSGSAAQKAAGRLRRAGCRVVSSPESFFVIRDVPPHCEKRRHGLERL
jgi:flavodoxin